MSFRSFELGKHVIGFIATTKVDKQLVENVHIEIEKRLEKHKRISLFCENASGETSTFSASVENILFKIKHKDRFDKIAIVSDSYRDELKSKIECQFVNCSCEFFSLAQRAEALQWVSL